MEEIFNTIGEAFGGVISSAPVQLGLRAAAIYIIVIWIAAAYWAFRDIQLRMDNPIVPYLVALFIIYKCTRFAVKRLIQDNKPPEHEDKSRDDDDDDDDD